MNKKAVNLAVTLIAGGPVTRRDVAVARALAPRIVAADSGGDQALRFGIEPELVVGDLDSLSAQSRAHLGPARVHLIAEQVSTDFEKALSVIAAPFIIALGVLGGRIDHELAVLSTLAQRAPTDPPIIALGAQDVVFACPAGRDLELRLPLGARLSLFPMSELRGRAEGLRWPLEGLVFHPAGRVGTSNETSARRQILRFDGAGMLVILPRRYLKAALRALTTLGGRNADPA